MLRPLQPGLPRQMFGNPRTSRRRRLNRMVLPHVHRRATRVTCSTACACRRSTGYRSTTADQKEKKTRQRFLLRSLSLYAYELAAHKAKGRTKTITSPHAPGTFFFDPGGQISRSPHFCGETDPAGQKCRIGHFNISLGDGQKWPGGQGWGVMNVPAGQ